MTLVSTILLLLIIAATMMSAGQRRHLNSAIPFVTIGVAVSIAACFAAQLIWPPLLSLGQRDLAAVSEGQIYRLATALWLQDGGVPGGIFNLCMLGLIGTAAEALFERRFWVSAYMIGGVAVGIVALWWQPVGAGNSIAYLTLAGAVLASGIARSDNRPTRYLAAAGICLGGALCLLKDIHGISIILGALMFCILRFKILRSTSHCVNLDQG